MRIFLFITLSLLVWGCSTVEVTKEVIKVTNTVADKVKESIPKKETEEKTVIEEIIEDNEIEEETGTLKEEIETLKKDDTDLCSSIDTLKNQILYNNQNNEI